MSAYEKPFSPPEDVVVEGSGCTYCGAGVGEDCASFDRHRTARAHAARWYDYWNATHDRQIKVFRVGEKVTR